MMRHKNENGFTLIELLIIISIIGMLSATILVRINDARVTALNTRRIQELNTVKKALDMYYQDNGVYPSACNPNGSREEDTICANNQLTGANGYIPNLSPTYINKLPRDIKTGQVGCGYTNPLESRYMYLTNASRTEYKFINICLGPYTGAEKYADPVLANAISVYSNDGALIGMPSY